MYSDTESDLHQPAHQSSRLTCFLGALAAVLCLCLALSIPVLVYAAKAKSHFHTGRKDTVVDQIIRRLMSESIDVALPTRYLVPDKFIIPPTDQGQRGTCWAFGALLLLESQYRACGIDHGFLEKDEYVFFSEQAYLKWLGELCQAHQEVAACQHGGFGVKDTADHKLDSIYYFLKAFPELAKSVLPASVCPYQVDESKQWECTGMEEALKKNPIEFKIKNIEAASDIESAKRLLVKAGRPIGVGVPINSVKYWAPCDASSWGSDPECTNKATRCPAGYESEFCKTVIVDSRIRDGTFTYVDDLKRTVPAGGHAMDVVGYNDDWVYRSRKGSERGLANLKGGFILHNSWRAPGHSVEFLLGRLSDENEAVQCPNHLSPMNWIPATPGCIKENKGDATKCGTWLKRVRGRGLANHSDVLKCLDKTVCDVNKKYALAEEKNDVDVQPLSSGLDKVHLVSWTGDGSDEDGVDFDYCPFWALKKYFEPEVLVENEPDTCGYWMYPYDAIALANRAKISLFDTFHVTDIEFEFTNTSYARNQGNPPDLDYSLLNKSTNVFHRLEFDGALPYDYVY